eukprot:13264038-Alexandrium_andersonii.AAC.1
MHDLKHRPRPDRRGATRARNFGREPPMLADVWTPDETVRAAAEGLRPRPRPTAWRGGGPAK